LPYLFFSRKNFAGKCESFGEELEQSASSLPAKPLGKL